MMIDADDNDSIVAQLIINMLYLSSLHQRVIIYYSTFICCFQSSFSIDYH